MKIVVLDGYTTSQNDLSFDSLKDFGEVTFYERTPKDLVVERIGDAEIVLTNKVKIDKEILDACKNLKLIAVCATGYNIIDCEYATKCGVKVANVPGYSTDSVVQHTFALLLDCMSKVSIHNAAIKNKEWEFNKDFCFLKEPIYELSGKTFGIIGYGSIGQKVATAAKAFSMNVIYNRVHADANTSTLDEIFKYSDIISLHCPQTKDNAKFINKEAISKMKDGVILINTARGGVVDEDAILEGIESKKIAYYLTDVLSVEPPIGNKLQYNERVIVTPHIAWATFEARQRLIQILYKNIKSFIEGNPINIVNNY